MADQKLIIRGDSLNAYRSFAGKYPTLLYKVNAAPAVITPAGVTGLFGTQVIDVSSTSNIRGIGYYGRENLGPLTGGFGVLMRIVPKFSGIPTTNQALFQVGAPAANQMSGLELYIDNSGAFTFFAYNTNGQLAISVVSTAKISFTNNQAVDIQISWDGTVGTGKIKISVDGAVFASLDAGAALSYDYLQTGMILIGNSIGRPNGNYYLNEFVFFDYAPPATYTTRTGFYTAAAYDAFASVDPGVANVKTGTAYVINGANLTGTYTGADRWSDPGAANVYLGLTYLANGVTRTGLLDEPDPSVVKHGVLYYEGQRTGTYRGADLWSDPGAGNVAEGVGYLADGASLTGTRNVVTNIIAEATLEGQSTAAELEAY